MLALYPRIYLLADPTMVILTQGISLLAQSDKDTELLYNHRSQEDLEIPRIKSLKSSLKLNREVIHLIIN